MIGLIISKIIAREIIAKRENALERVEIAPVDQIATKYSIKGQMAQINTSISLMSAQRGSWSGVVGRGCSRGVFKGGGSRGWLETGLERDWKPVNLAFMLRLL